MVGCEFFPARTSLPGRDRDSVTSACQNIVRILPIFGRIEKKRKYFAKEDDSEAIQGDAGLR